MATLPEIRALLVRLDGEPADALESETLECKSWDPHPAALDTQLREIRETVVCFANARGGNILVGIRDRKRTRREAIHGVGTLDPNMLRRRIYEGTEPRILVEIEDLIEPEGRLLCIRVPRGMPPHTTTEGVGKVRIGKDCKPLTGTELSRIFFGGGQRDMTGEIVPGATAADLDFAQIKLLKRTIETEGARRELARLANEELLQNLGLAADREITLAAILLLGRPQALVRWIPQHEVIFIRYKSATRYDKRHDLKGPLLVVLDELERILETERRVSLVQTQGFGEMEIPDLTWWTVREGVLNALVHRDYFLRQPVQVELHRDRLDVISPGGFVGGIRPANILRHPPIRRNPLLANVLQTAGLVNRAGLGVDRIFEELLRFGKPMPRYEGDESHVRLTLPTTTHGPFARFVAAEERENRKLELDDLIVLRSAAERGWVDRWFAGRRLQLPEEQAAQELIHLREHGYLVPQGRGKGTGYRLAARLAGLSRGIEHASPDTPLDEETVRGRIRAALAEKKQLTNTEVRRISGYSRTQALRLMQSLIDTGAVRLKGKGRGAHYVPASSNGHK